ncbi:unnamed protein product [Vicia faba]|uniref:Replication protein A 70 kDa DNA-binding subunit B/D first OB fold domain-containing protein n=1 Tax=Vicia faba TaxID=3906 RepID=A0AAV0YDM8_VICFA|nr:unnamed protein product [Vicia faba]
MEMGDKIQASVRKALLPRFENKIKEGSLYNFKSFGVTANIGAFRTTKHQFKLNLQNGTIVTYVGTRMTTLFPYSFVSFTNILGNIDMDYLIYVIGILYFLESNGIKLERTLFGPYVEALDAFLLEIPEEDDLKVCDNIGSPTQPFSYMKDASEMSLEE